MENERYWKLKTNTAESLRAIARIGKVFGVRGEVKIFSYSRGLDEYKKLPKLFVGKNESSVVVYEIESVKNRGDELYVKLKGIDDRTQAELVVGQYLFVVESERKKLPSGKFFHDEIVGCVVVDEQGKKFGVVKDVQQYPAHPLYAVATKKGDVLMPAAGDIIQSVNIKRKEIVVHPPEGLFDGEMAE
ncbi:MAG: ribosome maturation factor RimM [Bacteroidota bacterium]|nr:ribosome maturation factor RimM [Bacteroidota bacterium]